MLSKLTATAFVVLAMSLQIAGCSGADLAGGKGSSAAKDKKEQGPKDKITDTVKATDPNAKKPGEKDANGAPKDPNAKPGTDKDPSGKTPGTDGTPGTPGTPGTNPDGTPMTNPDGSPVTPGGPTDATPVVPEAGIELDPADLGTGQSGDATPATGVDQAGANTPISTPIADQAAGGPTAGPVIKAQNACDLRQALQGQGFNLAGWGGTGAVGAQATNFDVKVLAQQIAGKKDPQDKCSWYDSVVKYYCCSQKLQKCAAFTAAEGNPKDHNAVKALAAKLNGQGLGVQCVYKFQGECAANEGAGNALCNLSTEPGNNPN